MEWTLNVQLAVCVYGFPIHGLDGGSKILLKIPSVLNIHKHDSVTMMCSVYIMLSSISSLEMI